MLMSKNVNNDVSKDSPIPSHLQGNILLVLMTRRWKESTNGQTGQERHIKTSYAKIYRLIRTGIVF